MFSNLFGDGLMGTILAAVIGICLLGLMSIQVWRAFGRGIRTSINRGGRQPRLGVIDAYDVDSQRQLVLVRRDNVEHLILIGGPNDLLIERGIVRAQPSGAERREPVGVPVPGEPRPQPQRMPFEPAAASAAVATPPGQAQTPRDETTPAQEAAAPVAATPPPLRAALDQAFGEALGPPPPPLGRPMPVSEARNLPQGAPLPPPPRAVPPVRPAPGPQRPAPPLLAQRLPNAPAAMPPTPPFPQQKTRRPPEMGKSPGSVAAQDAAKLTLSITSLEEEMAKLLGRPVEPPKS